MAEVIEQPAGVKGIYKEKEYKGGPQGGRTMLHAEGVLKSYLPNRESEDNSLLRQPAKEGGSPFVCANVHVEGLGDCLLVVSTKLVAENPEDVKSSEDIKPDFRASETPRDFGVYTIKSKKTGESIRLAKFILGGMNINDEEGKVDALIQAAEAGEMKATVAQ